MNTFYSLTLIIMASLFLAAVIDRKIRKKTLIDKYDIKNPTIEGDPWVVKEVLDLGRFFKFVFSQATEEDCLIIKNFTGCVEPHLWMKFYEHEDRDNLALVLTKENKRFFLEMLDEVSVFSNVVYLIQITDGKNWLLLSNDWPSCCWLSNKIPGSQMKKAARGGAFRYGGYDNLEDEPEVRTKNQT